MTVQLMPSLCYEDQAWALADADWECFRGLVPKSSDFGFETCTEHTASWGGRVDHFAVINGMLKLLECEVHLAPGFEQFKPPEGLGRRDVTRQSWGSVRQGDGNWKKVLLTHESTYIEFENCDIPYTGTLIGGRHLRISQLTGGYQHANRFEQRLILEFKDGVHLTEASRLEFGSCSDDFSDTETSIRHNLMKRILNCSGFTEKA